MLFEEVYTQKSSILYGSHLYLQEIVKFCHLKISTFTVVIIVIQYSMEPLIKGQHPYKGHIPFPRRCTLL